MEEDPVLLRIFDAAGQQRHYETSMRNGFFVCINKYDNRANVTHRCIQLCVELPPLTRGLRVADGVQVVMGGRVLFTSPVPWNGQPIRSGHICMSIMYPPQNTEGRVEILALLFPVASLPLNILNVIRSNTSTIQSRTFATGDPGITIEYNFYTMQTSRQIDTIPDTHD